MRRLCLLIFKQGKLISNPAEPAGSTRTTEAIDGEKDRGRGGEDASISSSNSENVIVGSTDPGASAILKQK